MSNLKPCPFCGGEVNIEKVTDDYPNYVVCCSCCRVSTTWFSDKALLLAAWNRRAEQPSEPLTLYELREINSGKYIWLVDRDEHMPFEGWAVCDGKIVYYYFWNEHSPVGTAAKLLSEKYYTQGYNKTWRAYRRKPSVEEQSVYDNIDECVMCGGIVPEGLQVCPLCEERVQEGEE